MLEVTYSTLLTLRTPDILTFDRLAVPNTCKLHVDTPLVLLIVVETTFGIFRAEIVEDDM